MNTHNKIPKSKLPQMNDEDEIFRSRNEQSSAITDRNLFTYDVENLNCTDIRE